MHLEKGEDVEVSGRVGCVAKLLTRAVVYVARVKKLLELDAPKFIIDNEKEMLIDSLALKNIAVGYSKIICFYKPSGEYGYLSNFYPSEFTINGISFSCVEQFMMYRKAICFHDDAIAAKILATRKPVMIRALGRKVSNYDENVWNGVRQIVVYDGLLAKFSQNKELQESFKSTGDALLAECAGKDCIWGVGLSMKNIERFDKTKWSGQNLLGYALMMVREKI